MFVAKFQQVSSSKFKTDKNNNYPYIGEILAGQATGSIINGTMFQREGLLPNKAYLCQNIEEEYEGETQIRTSIISEVSLIELQPLMIQLGKPKLIVNGTDSETPE